MRNDELLGIFQLPLTMTGDVHQYLVVRQFFCRRLDEIHRKMCLCMMISAQQGVGPDKIPFMQLCNCDELFDASRRPLVVESIQTHESE